MPTISVFGARAVATVPTGAVSVRPGDLSASVIIVGAISLAFTTTAVVLRLWSRARSTRKLDLWWDDWALVATVIFLHAFICLDMAWTSLGLGKHIEAISTTSLLPTIYMSKASILLYTICIWLIKLSSLLMYARIFGRSPTFRTILWCSGACVTSWFICTAIVPWFNCTPVRKTLDPFLPGQCFDRMAWFLTSSIINATIDLFILLLPIPMLWRLHMTTS
ncbi:putative Integral membrane protein [Seiridium cardinale]